MALTINYATKVITVPQADLTLISGTLYELDTDQFRKDVMAILDDETHIWMPNAFTHNTEVTVAGVTFARTVEFINGYSVEFEDAAYSVRLSGSNNNIFDVENGILVQNTVQVIAQNSAGLVNATSATTLMNTVVEEEGSITFQQAQSLLLSGVVGEVTVSGDTVTFRTPDGAAVRIVGTAVSDGDRSAITITPSS